MSPSAHHQCVHACMLCACSAPERTACMSLQRAWTCGRCTIAMFVLACAQQAASGRGDGRGGMCGRFALSLRFSSRPRNRKHTHTLRLEVFLRIHSTMALRRAGGPHSSASSTTATTATFRRGGGILCRGSVCIVTTGLNEALTPQPSSSLVLQVPRSLSRTNASSFTHVHGTQKARFTVSHAQSSASFPHGLLGTIHLALYPESERERLDGGVRPPSPPHLPSPCPATSLRTPSLEARRRNKRGTTGTADTAGNSQCRHFPIPALASASPPAACCCRRCCYPLSTFSAMFPHCASFSSSMIPPPAPSSSSVCSPLSMRLSEACLCWHRCC